MVEHDGHVGLLCSAKLKETGLEENTIVMYPPTRLGILFPGRTGTTMFRGGESHELGGRLPGADAHPLARRDQARHDHQRDRFARGH